MFAVTLSLGQWQTRRAEEKTVLQHLLESRSSETPVQLGAVVADPDTLRYRHVTAEGTFVETRQIFLDNKVFGELAGYYVLTPLLIAGTNTAVFVNRGWIARGREYPRPPAVAVPAGPVAISGIATTPSARFLELSGANIDGQVWQNLTFDRARKALGLNLLPIVILADRPGDGLAAVTETPDAGIDMHRGYALQWYSLAAVLCVLWIVVNTRIDRTRK